MAIVGFFELYCEAKIRVPSVEMFKELVDLLHADFKDAKLIIDIPQPYLGSIRRKSVQFLLHLGHEEISENRR